MGEELETRKLGEGGHQGGAGRSGRVKTISVEPVSFLNVLNFTVSFMHKF